MLIHAYWCWLILIDADWWWLMLIGADRCWLVLIGVDWCWLNHWCDTRVTLERTLDMLRSHVPWTMSNGRANVIFDQTGVTWTPLGPLQLHQSWKRISGVFQPNFVFILSVIIHTICFYVDCYLLISNLTFTLVFNHIYSNVASIAVSVFVVILVGFEKYWDEQACLLKWS